MLHWATVTALLLAVPSAPGLEEGTVAFSPRDEQAAIPARYRLEAHSFAWEMSPKGELPIAGVEIFDVRFPSPVKTRYPENNTVHAEYYRPKKVSGPFPAVIVLDITGGNQKLSRIIARHLAQNGIGGLFVQMAYYGPRRPPGRSP